MGFIDTPVQVDSYTIDYQVILDIEMNKLIATLYHYKFV